MSESKPALEYKTFPPGATMRVPYVSVHVDGRIHVNAPYSLTPAEADELAEYLRAAAKEVRSR